MCTLVPLTVDAGSSNGLDIRDLDPAAQHFCEQGITTTTRKTYQFILPRFTDFCSRYNVLTSFPESESLLCYYASFLATDRLSPQVYLDAIHYMQITMGLPEPQEFSSMPRLCLAFNSLTVSRPWQRSGFQ